MSDRPKPVFKFPEATTPPPKPPARPPKKPRGRATTWTIRSLYGLMAVVAVLLILLPSLLSTGIARSAGLAFVNRAVEGQVNVEDWSIGWTSGVWAKRLSFESDDQTVAAEAEEIQINSSLFSLMWGGAKAALAGGSTLRDGYLRINAHDGETITLDNVQLSSQVRPDGMIQLQFDGVTARQGLQGAFEGSLIADRNLRLANSDAGVEGMLEGHLKLENWPVEVLDHLLNTQGLAQAALGPVLDMNAMGELQDDDLRLDIRARSKNLRASVELARSFGLLSLTEPGSIEWMMTPELVELLSEERRAPVKLADEIPVQINVSRLDIPIERDSKTLVSARADLSVPAADIFTSDGQRLHISSLTGTFDSGSVMEPPTYDLSLVAKHGGREGVLRGSGTFKSQCSLEQTDFVLSAENLPAELLDLLADSKQAIASLTGGWLAGRIEGSGGVKGLEGTLTLSSPYLTLTEARFTAGDALVLTHPATLQLALPTEEFESSLGWGPVASASGRVLISGELEALQVPLTKKSAQLPSATGFLRIEEPVSFQPGDHRPIEISKLALTAQGDEGKLDLEVSLDGTDGPEVNTLHANWRWGNSLGYLSRVELSMEGPHVEADLKGKVERFVFIPSSPLNLRASLPPKLVALLTGGDIELLKPVTVALDAKTTPILLHKSGLSDVELDGQIKISQLAMATDKGPVSLDDFAGSCKLEGGIGRLELQATGTTAVGDVSSPLKIDTKVTGWRQGWDKMRGTFAISSQALPTVALDLMVPHARLSESLGPYVAVNIKAKRKEALQGTLTATLKSDTASLTGEALLTRDRLEIKAKSGAQNYSSQLALNVTGRDFVDRNQEFDFAHATWKWELEGKGIHLPTLMRWAGQPQHAQHFAQGLMGDATEVHLAGNLAQRNGAVTASLKGSHASANLTGDVKDGVFVNNTPITVSVDVTPEVSRVLLSRVNPLLISAVGSEKPVTLTIDKRRLAVPVLPIDGSKLKLLRGEFNLGKIYLESQGPMAGLVTFLKLNANGQNGTTEAWFTPQYFSIDKQRVRAERADLLLGDTFHMATWGDVDLANDQIEMVVGLSTRTLKHAFGIGGLVPGRMLQIPLRGHIAHPKIDLTKASTRLAALMAEDSSGDLGGLVGGVLQTLGDKEGVVPPPTTTPLPWGGEAESPSREDQFEDQVKKGLRNILKKL